MERYTADARTPVDLDRAFEALKCFNEKLQVVEPSGERRFFQIRSHYREMLTELRGRRDGDRKLVIETAATLLAGLIGNSKLTVKTDQEFCVGAVDLARRLIASADAPANPNWDAEEEVTP